LLAGGAAIAPYLLAQHQRLMTMGFHRPLSEVNGVFHLKDLLLPARGHWLTGRVLGFDVRTDIYSWDLGLVFIALILVQCALSGKSRWRVRMFSAGTARGLTLMGAVALLLGFGPRLGITLDGEPVGPYALLSLIVPGLDGIRSPARLALFSTLAVSSVGAAAYAGLRSRVNRPLARMAFTFGVIVCLAAEMVTMPIPLTSAALESPGVKQAVDWLRLTEDRAPVVELPLAQSGIPADLEPEVRAMRRALLHGHPVVNGYSGHFPETFWQIGLATIQDPAGSGARYLQALGVRYVLVAHPAAPQTWRDSWRATSLRHWQFAGGVTIYELAAVPQPESVEVDTQMKLRQPPEPGMMISIKLTRPATTAALASPPASRRISIAWETRPHYWETIEVQCSGQVLADAGARVVYVELIELPGWFGDGRARLVSAERVRHVQQRRATPNPY